MNRKHREPVNAAWRPAHGGLVAESVLLFGLGWGLTARGRTLTFKLGVDRESLTGTILFIGDGLGTSLIVR